MLEFNQQIKKKILVELDNTLVLIMDSKSRFY